MARDNESERTADRLLSESFGKRVRKLREEFGLDATALAHRAGMTQAFMWRLENGRSMPNLRTIARVSLALGVPIVRLVEDLNYREISLASRGYDKKAD